MQDKLIGFSINGRILNDNNTQGNHSSVKCLSLRQPYAGLLASGKKTIELRKWNTNFRGKFLIHASKNVNKEKCKSLNMDQDKLSIGAIMGRAILYDIRRYDNKAQFMRDKGRCVKVGVAGL